MCGVVRMYSLLVWFTSWVHVFLLPRVCCVLALAARFVGFMSRLIVCGRVFSFGELICWVFKVLLLWVVLRVILGLELYFSLLAKGCVLLAFLISFV